MANETSVDNTTAKTHDSVPTTLRVDLSSVEWSDVTWYTSRHYGTGEIVYHTTIQTDTHTLHVTLSAEQFHSFTNSCQVFANELASEGNSAVIMATLNGNPAQDEALEVEYDDSNESEL